MKSKSKFAFVAMLLVIVVSVAVLCAACVDDNDNTGGSYEIPADLNVGVSFFEGDANSLLGMVTKNSFAEVAQSVIEVNGASYVAYKVADLTADFDIPASFNTIRIIYADESQQDITLNSFASSYIAVGTVENGTLVLGSAPYFIVNAAATSDNVFGKVTRIYIDPAMDNAPTLISAEDKFDLSLISISEVVVSAGNEQLFSFKKSDLASLDQYLVTLTAESKKYVGFKFTDIVDAKGAILPESFSTVKAAGSGSITKEISSFENSYVLVRKADDPSYEELNNIPRFVFDYSTVADVNSDVAKAVTSIIIDPEEAATAEDELLATLTLEWDGLNLSIALDDVCGATDDGTILISTPDTDPESVTSLSVGTSTVAGKFAANAVVTKSTNKDGDFYGYSLNDILSCLGKINKQGEFKPADYQVSYVKYTVSSSDGNVVSDVISENTEFAAINVINYTLEDPPTRVYLASGNVKNVVAISLYRVAE